MATPREQCEGMLADWDGGKTIWTIEMGGLGPGYEQAIQVLALEILRDNLDNVPDKDTWSAWGDSTITKLDEDMGGFSGAQVWAAKNLAHKWLTMGPEAVNAIPNIQDRRIQVSSFWPRKTA